MSCEKCGASRLGTERLCFRCGESLPREVAAPARPLVETGNDEQTQAMCLVHGQPASGSCSRCGRFNCHRCDPLSRGRCSDCALRSVSGEPPRLDGWLILPLAVLLLIPLTFVGDVVNVGIELRHYSWDAFLHPAVGTPPYALLIVSSLLTNLLVACIACYTFPRFLRRQRGTPRLMRIFLVTNFLVVLGEVTLHLALRVPFFTYNPAGRTVGWLLFTALWLAYFSRSERVKRTFVR